MDLAEQLQQAQERLAASQEENTRLRAALDAQARLSEELQDSAARYRLLYDAIPDGLGVLTFTPDGRPNPFLEVNDVFCRRLGYTREELMRLTPLDIDAPESEGGTDPRREVFPALMAGREITFEQVHKTIDGRLIPVEIHVSSFRLQGQPALLALVRDISERKAAEAGTAPYAIFRRDRRGDDLLGRIGKRSHPLCE